MKDKVKVTHEGWFLFCPVWVPEGQEDNIELSPIPKFRMWWLLDLALLVQQGMNWFISLFNEDAVGFVAVIKELKTPKYIKL